MDPTLQAKIDEAKANGYSDEEINSYIQNQGQPVPQQVPMDRSESMWGTGEAALGKAAQLGAEGYLGYRALKGIANAAGNAVRGGPVAPSTPLPTSMPIAEGVPPEPVLNSSWDAELKRRAMMDRAKTAAMGVGGMAALPGALSLPYGMAAYEQSNIRQNPNAPQYQFNPYAQQVRGEAATQGQAGAANQMRAVANMPFGNVNPQERQILEQDALMRQNIRKKAYEKVMGPVAPGQM